MITFNHLTKQYDDTTVVDDLNLDINEGELFVLVGTSGSGKTTTLKMINRLITPTSGQVLFAKQPVESYPVRELRYNIGYVLQQIALFPTMTVGQNIALIPELKHWPKAKVHHRVNELLDSVDLPHEQYRHRYPKELSGGEQQRIGILRALASQPQVILMDEPFSALDPISRAQLQDLVLKLHDKYHQTVLFVTHDMAEAVKLGDRIGVMSHGKLLQVDTPEAIQTNPVDEFVSSFFASTTNSDGILEQPARELKTFGKATISGTVSVKSEQPIETVIAQLQVHERVNVTSDPAFSVSAAEVLQYLNERLVADKQ